MESDSHHIAASDVEEAGGHFGYEDYDALCTYFGLHDIADAPKPSTSGAAVPANLSGTERPVHDAVGGLETSPGAGQELSFTPKPLSFLQEWLNARRKGQDYGRGGVA